MLKAKTKALLNKALNNRKQTSQEWIASYDSRLMMSFANKILPTQHHISQLITLKP